MNAPRRGGTRFRRLVASLSVLIALCAVAASALAVPTKQVRFQQHGNAVTMSVGFREMFDEKLTKRLKSGFTTTVVMRVYLYEEGGGRPIVAVARRLRAVYDLWDEHYRLRIDDPAGSRVERWRDTKKVVDRLTSFWRFPLMRYAALRAQKRYFVAGIIEVNPMSPQLLAAVRRWLRKPARRQVGGDSLFGSFVSIFVNDKIRRAEKTFKFRSQPFFRQP